MTASVGFRRAVGGLFLVALGLVSSTPAAAQAHGLLFGVVVDDRNDAPVAGAGVQVVGTGLRAEADANGVFLLRDLPFGPVNVRIERSGYSTVVERTEIRATGPAVFEVRLVPMAVSLEELSVIGHRSSRARGYSVTEVGPVTDSDMTAADLVAGTAGLSLSVNGGLLGSAAGVRIRGTGSLAGSSAPSIYLDGILIGDRASPRSSNARTPLSVLSQIPAKDVARILVFRGPSAGAAYPGAAHGVIVIETVRGGF